MAHGFGDGPFEREDAPEADDYPDDCCPDCGGEGVIYMCVSEYACINPEDGCDLCERICDCQRPAHPPAQQPEPRT